MKLADVMPVDSIVSRNDALSSVLISAVRYPGGANTLALLDQIGAETIQATIPEGSPATGVELRDLPLPSGALIGLVSRGGEKNVLFIPTGNSSLAAGDRVIVFTSLEAADKALDVLGVRAE
jgi:Trk K+ transport system NAD-binding subunit